MKFTCACFSCRVVRRSCFLYSCYPWQISDSPYSSLPCHLFHVWNSLYVTQISVVLRTYCALVSWVFLRWAICVSRDLCLYLSLCFGCGIYSKDWNQSPSSPSQSSLAEPTISTFQYPIQGKKRWSHNSWPSCTYSNRTFGTHRPNASEQADQVKIKMWSSLFC